MLTVLAACGAYKMLYTFLDSCIKVPTFWQLAGHAKSHNLSPEVDLGFKFCDPHFELFSKFVSR
jgi:hypothetical protein